jgi:hypothetical protein
MSFLSRNQKVFADSKPIKAPTGFNRKISEHRIGSNIFQHATRYVIFATLQPLTIPAPKFGWVRRLFNILKQIEEAEFFEILKFNPSEQNSYLLKNFSCPTLQVNCRLLRLEIYLQFLNDTVPNLLTTRTHSYTLQGKIPQRGHQRLVLGGCTHG